MRKKEKGNGEGTIYKSSKTGLYVGQYVYDGKRKSVYQKKNEKTSDFKKRFTNIINDINMNTYISENNTSLYNILNDYIENKYKTGITTDRTYIRNIENLKLLKRCCNSFIYKSIQKVTISDIKKSLSNFVELEEINSKTNEKVVKKYSQSVIDKIYRLLKKGFKIAISERIIQYNIMENENIVKPKSKQQTNKVFALTVDEEKKLIQILKQVEHKYNNIILLALFTGMRIGEILALSRSNINIKDNTITIDKTLTRDKNDKVILGQTTKTKAGNRSIYLNNLAKEVIIDILKNKIVNIYDLVFFDYEKNTFITPNEINCYLKRITKKYNICSNIHTHMLRHTYATRCIEAGISVKVLQKNLGHEKIETTLNTYTDVFDKFNKNENEKYDSYMKQLEI